MTVSPEKLQASEKPDAARVRAILFSIGRILLGGLLLSVLVAGCLYLYHTAFQFFHARLIEGEKKTLAWIVEQLGFSLPFIVICAFHGIAYHGHSRDGKAEREMLWQIVVVTVLTYGVLLPLLSNYSRSLYEAAVEAGTKVAETEGGVPWTLLMKLHDWFIRLIVPLALLCVFHATRASRERRFPEEAEEPLMTLEEYRALHTIDTETEGHHGQANE